MSRAGGRGGGQLILHLDKSLNVDNIPHNAGVRRVPIEPERSGETTMSASSKTKTPLWYGYLEAGNRSSPVIRDERLDTGSTKTVFLFNLERGEILEYSRDVVETKLRDLKPSEAKMIKKLDTAYAEVRRNFKDRRARPLNIPEHGSSARRPVETQDDDEIDEFIDDSAGEDVWVDSDED
jgi:hypothetical protein